ncbi:DUF6506 family protein [Streptomyces sp. JNUCC 64]
MSVSTGSRERVVVYEAEGGDPAVDLLDVTGPGGRVRVRAVTAPEQAVALAARLVEDGVDLVELCGSFGARWHAATVRAVGGRARVGAVYYGFESLTPIAAYKDRFEAGEALDDAFLVVQDGADPERDRTVRKKADGGRITIVAVPDADAAARTAAALGDRLHLVEVYGAPGPEVADAVLGAVDPGVPVGLAVYGRD